MNDVKIFGGLVGLALLTSCARLPTAPAAGTTAATTPLAKVDFTRDIKPLFESSCVQCHARGKDKGGFSLETRASFLKGGDSGKAAIPGKSGQSPVVKMVAGTDPDTVMPKKGKKFTAEQVELFREWIDGGMPWPREISFAKKEPVNLLPRTVVLPKARKDLANPVDRLLQPYFAKAKFATPGVVGDNVYARRVYLDVIGLLPTPEQLEAFVSDQGLDKRERLVKTLLADKKHYAENWLSFWNDHLRNDYKGTGYIDGGRKQITAWLYKALLNDLPYDQFVAELINPTADTEGFTKGIVWRGVVNASMTPQMQAAQNISQVFMGVNLKCAACHDSFINDWTLEDSYGLASVFAESPLEMVHCDKPTGKVASVKFLYPELGAIDTATNKATRTKQLAALMTGKNNGRLSRTIVNRLWARFMGRGLVEPLDDMEKPAWKPEVLDWLAEDLVSSGYDLKHTMEMILTSKAYQLPSVDLGELASKDFVFRGPGVRRLNAEQYRDALGSITGAWFVKPSAAVGAKTNEVRSALVPADALMLALGRPNREQVMTTRASAATTLQALELTNGATLAGVLKTGAEKMAAITTDTDSFVTRVYAQGLCRPPTAKELGIAREVLGKPASKEGMEDLLWAVTMLPEFQLIY